MSPIEGVFILSVLIVSVTSFQSNCDPFNQFKFYCFPVEYCYVNSCQKSPCGTYNAYSKLVKIKYTKIIPKCAFTNSEYLEQIHGVNSDIEIIASGAFANLTNLKDINLSLNSIRELHVGTFYNVSATNLDLSWNKLAYIQEGAFKGLHNLKSLNLSRNELSVFPIHHMPLELSEINLSHNLFNRVIFTSKRIPRLTDIDLSFNKIEKIALAFDNPVHKIDLTSNELKKFDHIDIYSCEELRIALNRFSEAPENLPYLNLNRVALYPNPWNCVELQKLWNELQNNFIKVLNHDESNDNQPVCGISQENIINRVLPKLSSGKICKEDFDCEEDRICRTNRCLDPCSEGLCDSTSVCQVNKHHMKCKCREGLKRDPANPNSACQDVECFVKSDCPDDMYCYGDKKCNSAIGGHFEIYGSEYSSSTAGYSTFKPAPSIPFVPLDQEGNIIDAAEEPWWAYEIYSNDSKPVSKAN